MDGGAAGGEGVELGEFLLRAGQADLESFGFAVPALTSGFGDAGQQAAADGFQPRPLGGVNPQEGAPEAPLTELTAIFQQFIACFRSSTLTCPRDRIR